MTDDVTREAVARAIMDASGLRSEDFAYAGFWLQIADAAIAAYEKSRWRPMAEAPADGTPILWWDGGTFDIISWPEYRECFSSGRWRRLPSPPVTIGEG